MRTSISVFFFLSVFVSYSYAQSSHSIFDDICSEYSQVLAWEILDRHKAIKANCDNRNFVSVQMVYLVNSHGQPTRLSEELGRRLTLYLQRDLNRAVIKSVEFALHTPYEFDVSMYEQIDKTKGYDFALAGEYRISPGGIRFSRFRLRHIHSDSEYVFKDYTVANNQTELLDKYNGELLTENVFQNFMDFHKDDVSIKSAKLVTAGNEEKHFNIEGIGKVYDTKYEVHYNMELNINEDTYLYAFFYEPESENYNFLWAIENPNKLYSKGVYTSFFEDNFYFYSTGESGQYSYLKLIASKQKIDIRHFYTKQFIDGHETTLINSENCKLLLDYLVKTRTIQTQNIVLTF